MREHESNAVLRAEVGEPVPAEDALGGDDEVVLIGSDRVQKGARCASDVPVHQDCSLLIGQAQVHGSRV
jgi:hypothetical protein